MRNRMRWLGLGLTVVLIVGLGIVAYAVTRSKCSAFQVVYDGYGSVECTAESVALLPATATDPGVTHGALVDTGYATTPSERPMTVKTTMTTHQQLRDGEPNPWEVGWVLWNYTDPTHFYALALKPNGWEVSKQDVAYDGAQRFLASGDERVFPIGQSYQVEVTLTSSSEELRMDISVDGEHLSVVTDSDQPYLSGDLALYCEDAAVTFTEFTTSPA